MSPGFLARPSFVASVAMLAALALEQPAQAQQPSTVKRDTTTKAAPMRGGMADMPGMVMPDTSRGHAPAMAMMTPDPLGVSMDRMGSGTTWVPEAAPIPS